MKRLKWYLAGLLLIAALSRSPFAGTDVAKLQPVELIRVTKLGENVLVETDTGDTGFGSGLKQAFEDLKQTTAGEVFLETAEHVLLSGQARELLEELAELLRPGCSVCIQQGEAELEAAAEFLDVHKPEFTLRAHRAGEGEMPVLLARKERMYLVE